jgi:hypothetical protein
VLCTFTNVLCTFTNVLCTFTNVWKGSLVEEHLTPVNYSFGFKVQKFVCVVRVVRRDPNIDALIYFRHEFSSLVLFSVGKGFRLGL